MTVEKIFEDRVNKLRNTIPKLKKGNQKIALLFVETLTDEYARKKIKAKEKFVALLVEGKTQLDEIFSGNRAELIPFFVGKDNAKRFEKLWNRLTITTYQGGWYRRSFRTKKQTALYFDKGIGLISSFFLSTTISFTVKEYLDNYIKSPHNSYSLAAGENVFEQPIRQQILYSSLMQNLIALDLDEKDEFVTNRIKEIIYDDNNVGILTREIIRGVLISRNADSHKLVGDLLFAAKLQEGLRQTIVEACDECSVEGFNYIINIILENNLERFSSIVRAIGTWTGLQTAEFRPQTIRKTLEIAADIISNKSDIDQLLESDDLIEIYVALWGIGLREIIDTRKPLLNLVKSQKKYKQLAALYFLWQTHDIQLMKDVILEILNEKDIELWSQLHGMLETVLTCELDIRINEKIQNAKSNKKVSDSQNEPSPSEYFLSSYQAYSNCGFGQCRINDDEVRKIFARLNQLAESTPKKETRFEPDASNINIRRLSANDFIRSMIMCAAILGGNDSDVKLLLSLIPKMDASTKENLVRSILKWDNPLHRKALVDLFCDSHLSYYRNAITDVFKNVILTSDEYETIEAALRFKDAALRVEIINLILKQPPENLQKSIERLISSKDEQKRLAGLDIIDQTEKLSKYKKEYAAVVSACKQLALTSADNEKKKGTKKSAAEEILVQKIAEKKKIEYTKENGFGLCDPNGKPNIPEPKKTKKLLADILVEELPRLEKFLIQLDELIYEHRDNEYSGYPWRTEERQTVVLGSQQPFWAMLNTYEERMKLRNGNGEPTIDDYPLAEVWKGLAEKHKLRSLDFLLLGILGEACNKSYNSEFENFCQGRAEFEKYAANFTKWFNNVCWCYEKMKAFSERYKKKFRYLSAITDLVRTFERSAPKEEIADSLIEILSGIYAATPKGLFTQPCRDLGTTLYFGSGNMTFPIKSSTFFECNTFLRTLLVQCQGISVDVRPTERFNILYKYYEAVENCQQRLMGYLGYYSKLIPSVELFEKMRDQGTIDDSELLREMLIRPNRENVMQAVTGSVGHWRYQRKFGTKKQVNFPHFQRLLPSVIDRILEIELSRGDTETEVSPLIKSIGEFEGIRYFVDILKAMDKTPLVRGYSYSNNLSRADSFCFLLKVCEPEDKADSKLFAGIPEQRLLEAAMYAPQWIDLVQEFLGWQGLMSACWYFHAHINESMSETKESIIARYSPISPRQFKDGAFDINWFNDAYKTLGEKRFQMVYDAAKYITSGGNHRRAQIFADALRGKLKIADVEKSVTEKRNKDNLLAYSLLPLKKGNAGEKEQLARYNFIQKFLNESKKFGQQRKESEGKTCEIAFQNLALAAGYEDVNRFIWAMETEKSKGLVKYIVPKKVEGFELSIVIDDFGKPAIRSVKDDGTELKDIPAKLKKHAYVEELKETVKIFRDQFRNVRANFEKAMQFESEFMVEELCNLSQNPSIKPILSKLIYRYGNNFGFFADGRFMDVDGKISATKKLKSTERVLIAHPVHLFEAKVWKDFQKIVFEREMVQPFKQVFRELYLPNADEKKAKTYSNRYAGHQVQPSKTVALLRSRNWTIDQEFGFLKVFYKLDLMVRLYCYADWFMPSDVESPTIEKVEFVDRRTLELVPFVKIPPVIFSEVMRDLDLVISVAHIGGVDPEASLSTIEMRAAILEETLRLVKLKNVTFKKSHVLVKGTLGEYTIHLGSGEVQIMAGGSLTILPVHSQQRGRLFLPFIDDDPKTAEITSKTLLLAEDNKIKDPTILETIRNK
ncbi:MAG: DUF5724 domain-containing protein [Planctomycetaceae bacterium]|jgi:hypothetical protein|nr:DUF5724 domain-containing protein [Planctomycetaceae bacterium]